LSIKGNGPKLEKSEDFEVETIILKKKEEETEINENASDQVKLFKRAKWEKN
jgi:hypothetical protein